MNEDRIKELHDLIADQQSIIDTANQFIEFKTHPIYHKVLNRFNELYIQYKQDAYSSSKDKNQDTSTLVAKMEAMEDAILTIENHYIEPKAQAEKIQEEHKKELEDFLSDTPEDTSTKDEEGSLL